MKQNNQLISFMQVLGAVMVVLLHVPAVALHGVAQQYGWLMALHDFRMPLFVFISGYLMKYGMGAAYLREVMGGG